MVWAILFWVFLIAALIWLIAWLFLRQYFVDGAEMNPSTEAKFREDTPPISRDLRDRLDDGRSPGAPQLRVVGQGHDGATEFSDALTSGSARIDDELGVLYLSAPERIDDLKLIKGVGEVLEDKLHDFGVYHYKQIAHWRQGVVDEFNDRLAFKGRIERDSWIDQARELHRKKYGSSA